MSNSGQSGWNLVKTAVGKFPSAGWPFLRNVRPTARRHRPYGAFHLSGTEYVRVHYAFSHLSSSLPHAGSRNDLDGIGRPVS